MVNPNNAKVEACKSHHFDIVIGVGLVELSAENVPALSIGAELQDAIIEHWECDEFHIVVKRRK